MEKPLSSAILHLPLIMFVRWQLLANHIAGNALLLVDVQSNMKRTLYKQLNVPIVFGSFFKRWNVGRDPSSVSLRNYTLG